MHSSIQDQKYKTKGQINQYTALDIKPFRTFVTVKKMHYLLHPLPSYAL